MSEGDGSTLLGVDTGGTFTDFVVFDDAGLRVHKILSTPAAPERAILDGVAALGLPRLGLRVVHGSTVATNAALERKGVPTLYVANHGLGDLLTIGRQARRALYDLQPQADPPPVADEYCVEVGGRVDAAGLTVEPLTAGDLGRLRERIEALRPAAVAINLVFAWRNDEAERRLAAAVPAGVFVCHSSQVLQEYREYERGIATWLNAWLGPIMQGYLERLSAGLAPARLSVMQSSGGTIDADRAGARAVNLLLSGPAGGLVGARHVAAAAGRHRLLTLDMGGTSTDVAMIDGELRLTTEGRVGPWPVAVSMVDMHTIGAGGGSIAYLDAGGMLQVGPESAGADPGPACYRRGGNAPTVTDANLVLGRLRADAFLGGSMPLDPGRADTALRPLADAMGMSVAEAAAGVVAVANERMAHALRVISVQRGVDPRGFTLVSFGGAGGLHVCALAEALGMEEAMVPVHAGVLSALGMLAATPERQLSRSINRPLDRQTLQLADGLLAELEAQGREALIAEGVPAAALAAHRSADLRYLGQSFSLNLAWRADGRESVARRFHELHRQRYGHDLDVPVELVNLRVAVRGRAPVIELPGLAAAADDAQGLRGSQSLVGVSAPGPWFDREALGAGQCIDGPALITETVATTYLAQGWRCRVDNLGNLMLNRERG